MRRSALLALLAGVLAAGLGCATRRAVRALPPPLSEQQVIALHEAGVPEAEILRRISESRSVYYLTAEDIVRLRERGLSDELVTCMMDTRARNAARAAAGKVEDAVGTRSAWPRVYLGGSVVYGN